MALAGQVVDSICASLRKAEGFTAPFPYFRASGLFPASLIEALDALTIARAAAAAGRRECVTDRVYLNTAQCAGNDLLDAVVQAWQSPEVARALSSLVGAKLSGTYLRIEYAIDADGFWLEPHTDLGVKKFTGLIALSGAGQPEDLGTDLYRSAKEPFSRVPFESNAGTLFVPGSTTWHGFAQRPIRGLRKSLILNYVGPEWQSRDQLAFPDRPIAF